MEEKKSMYPFRDTGKSALVPPGWTGVLRCRVASGCFSCLFSLCIGMIHVLLTVNLNVYGNNKDFPDYQTTLGGVLQYITVFSYVVQH
ncbi:hypothetical protein GN956_G7588 [Arapaima gigas]